MIFVMHLYTYCNNSVYEFITLCAICLHLHCTGDLVDFNIIDRQHSMYDLSICVQKSQLSRPSWQRALPIQLRVPAALRIAITGYAADGPYIVVIPRQRC